MRQIEYGKYVHEYLNSESFKEFQVERNYYSDLEDFRRVIDHACFGIYKKNGLTFFCDHYKYVFEEAKQMYHARKILLENAENLQSATQFESLYKQVFDLIHSLPGIGNLLVYDISLRIGFSLKIAPNKIYAQRGALYGLAGLYELKTKEMKDPTIIKYGELVNNFPELEALKEACLVENFLCVFDNQLNGKKS